MATDRLIPFGRLASAIRNRPRAVSSLAAQFRVAPTQLSHHLSRLERQGRVRRDANFWSLAQ